MVSQPRDKETIQNLSELSIMVKSMSPTVGGMKALSPTFRPGPFDVICGRGKNALKHLGNLRFRQMIISRLEQYSKATTKLDKSSIVSFIVDSVRQDSPNGGFVKLVGDQWFEVGDHVAREKCGQSFRDALHTKYRSSTKAKASRRKCDQSMVGHWRREIMKKLSSSSGHSDSDNQSHYSSSSGEGADS